MAWTYILRCSDRSFYVGSTRNLDERMAQHFTGSAGAYTSTRRPVTLVWAHEIERIDEAWELEMKIKGWGRAKKVALIEGRFDSLPELSKSRRVVRKFY